ncbi:hypothetical protein [Lacibacter sp.]|uniref:hypothetical protein n=1 Tax=Lacibacter sp. TaxID=1915409 RepID=UPI002B4AD224|nr:hypothetical protein [Lacibacter sp.]
MADIMKTLLSISYFLLCANCFGQTKLQKLIVAEYRIDSPRIGNFTYLVSYNFANGLLLSKDTILGVPTNRKGIAGSYVRYDLGINFIYKNRYVISGIGNVIDIKTKSLVMEESDDFISAQGDTLIFHRDNIFTGTGYLMLDLKSRQYKFINQDKLDKDKNRRSSPDKLHYLSIDQSKLPYKIWLYNSDSKKKLVVQDAGHGPNIMYSSQFPTIETTWLNNHTFLYAVHETKFDDEKKDYSKVTLRQYDITTNSDQVFFVLDSVSNGKTNGRFFIDNVGQLIYRSSGWSYHLVDTVNRLLIDYPFYELGFGFSTANKAEQDGTVLKYNNIDIGKLWCSNEVVGEDVIAVEFGDIGSNLAYPKGFMTWSKQTNKWTIISIPWLSNLIGWVNEE